MNEEEGGDGGRSAKVALVFVCPHHVNAARSLSSDQWPVAARKLGFSQTLTKKNGLAYNQEGIALNFKMNNRVNFKPSIVTADDEFLKFQQLMRNNNNSALTSERNNFGSNGSSILSFFFNNKKSLVL